MENQTGTKMLTVVEIQTIVHLYRSGDYSRKVFSLTAEYATLAQAQAHLDDVCRRMDSEVPFGDAADKQLRISADLQAMQLYRGKQQRDPQCLKRPHTRAM